MNQTKLQYSRPLTPVFFADATHDDLKWTINYLISLLEVPEGTKHATSVEATKKKTSAWLQSMAKFRRLEPIDDKEALMESLDERYK